MPGSVDFSLSSGMGQDEGEGCWVKAGAAGWLCGAWPAPGTTRALLPEQESCFMLWFY